MIRRALRPLLLAAFAAHPAAATAAPTLVADINTAINIESSAPKVLGEVGGWTVFYTRSDYGEGALWRTDGTAAGTVRLHTGDDFIAYTNSFRGPAFATIANVGFFLANDDTHGTEIWRTDGTSAGTQRVTDLPGASLDGGATRILGVVNSQLIVYDGGPVRRLLRSDGTAAGTFAIAGVEIATSAETVSAGDRMFFAGQSTAGSELWVTDGSADGTHMVADLFAGPASSEPKNFVVLGDRLLFVAKVSIDEYRLQSMDIPTGALTTLNNTFGLAGAKLVRLDDIVLFVGGASYEGDFELWRTDGTVAGTQIVVDINPAPASPLTFGGGVVIVGDRALFVAADQNGMALWSTDGTAGQTIRIAELNPHPFGDAVPLAVIDGIAYFAVRSLTTAEDDVLQTDGTPGGTHRLLNLPTSSDSIFMRAAGGPGAVYLLTDEDINAPRVFRLWAHDPVTRQSVLLRQISNEPRMFATVGSKLLIDIASPGTGVEPWISDNTVAGTELLVDASPPVRNLGSGPQYLTDVGGTLFFLADDGVNGRQIWRSDGTLAGTRRATDQLPSAQFPAVYGLFGSGDSLYFYTFNSSSNERGYWRLPASGPPIKLADTGVCPFTGVLSCYRDGSQVSLSGAVYFINGSVVWRSDGTAAGTQALFASGDGPRLVDRLYVSGSRMYFGGARQGEPYAAWVSDGTAAGTCKLVDVSPPAAFVARAGAVYFWAIDGANGPQIWRTNGACGNATRISNDSFAPNPTQMRLYATGGGVFMQGLVQISAGNPMFPPSFAWHLWFNALDGTGSARVGGSLASSDSALVVGSQLLFLQGSALWTTDGTTAGTRVVRESSSLYGDGQLHDFRGHAAFFTSESLDSVELWTSDGTSAGTRSAGVLPWHRGPSNALPLPIASGHRLFFAHSDPLVGAELFALENQAPIAAADSGTVEAGHTLQMNPLGNDLDADGSIATASVRIVRQPSLGSATVSAAGAISYTPRSNESGGDSLEYVVADDQGRESNRATVSFTVQPSTAPPPGGGSGNSGGGGGGLGFLELIVLALLSLAGLCSRERAQTVPSRQTYL